MTNQTHQEKKREDPINKIRNEREVRTNTPEIKRNVRNYCEKLYAKEPKNLGERDTYLQRYNVPKLNQEEAESQNRLMTMSKIKAVIKLTPSTQM